MITSDQLIASCIERLASEGIEAFADNNDGDADSPTLRVPRLEDQNGLLCQTIIYGFISCKLAGNKHKGLRIKHPVTGAPYDIYCYDPDCLEDSPDAADLMVWSVTDDTVFDWTNLSLGDAGWFDGWELTDCDHLEQRVAFLTYLMSYEIIDLPKVEPLTLDELKRVATAEQAKGNKGRFCFARRPNDSWHLQVDPSGSLVMLMSNAEKVLPITAEHIDEAGRLVIDDHVALTRATPL